MASTSPPPDPRGAPVGEGAVARELGAGLAQLPPRPLSRELIVGQAGEVLGSSPEPGEIEDALTVLSEEGRLELSARSVVVPQEAASEVRASLGETETRHALAVAIGLVGRLFPVDAGAVRSWEQARRLLPHVLALRERAAEFGLRGDSLARLLNGAAEYLRTRGDYPLAIELARDAIATAGRSASDELQATLNYTLGRALADVGQSEEAREALSDALDLHLELTAPDDVAVRRDQIALAEVVGELGDLARARELVEAAITAHGDRSPDRIACLAHRRLGWVLMEEEEYEASRKEYELALEATDRVLGHGHPDLAEVRAELGALLLEVREWTSARAHLEQALGEAGGALGEEHPFLGVIRSNLGGALEGLGDYRAARVQVQRALAIGQAKLPPGHRGIWLRHRKLSRILSRLGEVRDARRHSEAAAAISERALGPKSVDFGRDLLQVAALRGRDAEPSEAAGTYARALPILEAVLPEGAVELAEAQLGYGRVLAQLGHLPQARARLERVLESFEAQGTEGTAVVRAELAALLSRLGNELTATLRALGRLDEEAEARELADAAERAALDDLLSEENPIAALAVAKATSASSPEVATAALRRAEELIASPSLEQALATWKRGVAFGWRHLALAQQEAGSPGVARDALNAALDLCEGDARAQGSLLRNLADLERETGDLERAEQLFERALEMLRSLPGEDPLEEGIALHELAEVASAQGDRDTAIRLYREAAERKHEADAPDQEAETLRGLARELAAAGDGDAALATLTRALELLRSLDLRDDSEEEDVLREMADIRRERHEFSAAIDLYRDAAERARGAGRAGSLSVLLLLLGRTLMETGEATGAQAVFRESAAAAGKAGDEMATAIALRSLAGALEADDDLEAALEAQRERLGVLEGMEHPEPQAEAMAMTDLADLCEHLGHVEEAIDLLRRAAEKHRDAGDHAGAARAFLTAALALFRTDEDGASSKPDVMRALSYLEEGREAMADAADPDALAAAWIQALVALCSKNLGHQERSVADREAARAALAAVLAEAELITEPAVLYGLGLLAGELDAMELCEQALAGLRERVAESGDDPEYSLAELLELLGAAQARRGDYPNAERFYRERLEFLRAQRPVDPEREAAALRDLADALRGQGDHAAAASLYRNGQ